MSSKTSNTLVTILTLALVLLITLSSRDSGNIGTLASQGSEDTSSFVTARPVTMEGVYSFAGEEMPMNWDNKQRLDRELTVNSYWHSNTMLTYKLAQQYFPQIDEILEREGVPADFKYIAVIESGLRQVTSPAGAKGFWQLMPAVAKSYDLQVTSTVDERYHIEKATIAACKHIKRYKSRFGTWTNAAAAYNLGETKFAAELERQHESSYYDMNFNRETNRYLFRILAMKRVFENPQNYGFDLSPENGYTAVRTHEVQVTSSVTSLADFAHKYGSTYRELKALNPWLLSDNLPVRAGQIYEIRIPAR